MGARARIAEVWRRERTARQLAALLGMSRQPRPAAATKAAEERRGGDYLAQAEAAAKDEEWGRVFGLLEAAEKLGLPDAERQRLLELQAVAGEQLARISASQARFAESTGDVGAALTHADLACKYGPSQAEYWDTTARLRLRLGVELHQARDAAMRAIQLAPKVASYHLTMARVYLAAGLGKNARREAETAVELDPHSRQAKSLLADAKHVAD